MSVKTSKVMLATTLLLLIIVSFFILYIVITDYNEANPLLFHIESEEIPLGLPDDPVKNYFD